MTDEQHLLVILAEEATELAQAATKAIRFGTARTEPYQDQTNLDRLVEELSDVLALTDMLRIKYKPSRIDVKQRQVRKAMKLSVELGEL